jgi:hypothetical protein
VKNSRVVRNFYVLPCCLLLLNLCNQVASYKARGFIDDALLRTAAVMAMVLFGGTLVGSVAEPVIGTLVGSLHHGTRARWGQLGEILFLVTLGAVVFWLYYRVDVYGPGSILPTEWRNARHR